VRIAADRKYAAIGTRPFNTVFNPLILNQIKEDREEIDVAAVLNGGNDITFILKHREVPTARSMTIIRKHMDCDLSIGIGTREC
jgi:hypothetical protein